MIRKNMASYLAERLVYFKKGYEGLEGLKDPYSDAWKTSKVQIGNFEFKFDYNLYNENLAKLNIKIRGLDSKAEHRLETKFRIEYFPENVKKGNLIIRELNSSEDFFSFNIELVSIHDKNTFSSVFEHFVKPLVLEK